MSDPNYYAHLYNEYDKKPRKIRILDSTLREGEQHPGVTFTNKQRIQIAWMLDYFGVDQIEISPVVSQDHFEATKTIIKQGLKADIVAHVRALKEDVDVALKCDPKWTATYLGISDIHMKDKMRITVEDGSRADPEFLLKVCKAIEEAGVDRISLPDTVGVMRPKGMYNFVKMVKEKIKVPLDVHCHNDIGLALANALAGVDAGAEQIHTTIDGIGERTGIPSLAEAAVALTYLYRSPNDFRLDMLTDLSRLIEDYTGITQYDSKPLVGPTAYKHKAGTHLAAILRNPAAYEPIPPRVVGNRRRIVFGELAGKTGSAYLMSLLGLPKNDEQAKSVAAGLKNLRMGDLLEIPLDGKLERKIINDAKGSKE